MKSLNIGLLLIAVLFLLTAIIMHKTHYKNWVAQLSVTCLCCVMGFMFYLAEKDTPFEFYSKYLGTIKTAASQAAVDAKSIEEIRKKIEAQQATVNLVAKDSEYVKTLVIELTNEKERISEKITTLKNSIQTGELSVKKLQDIATFHETILSAQNDGGDAFKKLLRWSMDRNYPFNKESANAIRGILSSVDRMVVQRREINWNVNPLSLDADGLRDVYKNMHPILRISLLEYVWQERHDLSIQERIQFLINALKEDASLKVLDIASRHISQYRNIKNDSLLEIESHIEWWEKQNKVIY